MLPPVNAYEWPVFTQDQWETVATPAHEHLCSSSPTFPNYRIHVDGILKEAWGEWGEASRASIKDFQTLKYVMSTQLKLFTEKHCEITALLPQEAHNVHHSLV